MALVPVDATSILLSVDLDSNGTFKVVGCGKTNDLDGTLSVIDYSSKCGNLYGPGSKFDQSIEFDGNAVDQTISDSIDSYNAIYAAWVAKTKFPARFGVLNPGATDKYFYGEVFIEKCTINAPYNDSYQFKATFRVTVPPMALYTGY